MKETKYSRAEILKVIRKAFKMASFQDSWGLQAVYESMLVKEIKKLLIKSNEQSKV